MPRYRFVIEYDGSPFAGWQRQKKHPSVQGEVERALLAFTGEAITLKAAGRTDTGVHATAQIVHFDLPKAWQARVLREATNAHLVDVPISIIDCKGVDDDFDARFSARERRYLYRIINRPSPPALLKHKAWHISKPLDIERMREGASYFIGTHDFTTFRASPCQAKNPIKTLDEIRIEAWGEDVMIYVRSRSFLHRQVRSMCGSLAEVGRGKYPPEWIDTILKAQDRRACGVVAPAHALYLMGVIYDSESVIRNPFGDIYDEISSQA